VAAFGIILLVLRWKLMGSTVPTFQVVDNPHSFVSGTILRVSSSCSSFCLLSALKLFQSLLLSSINQSFIRFVL